MPNKIQLYTDSVNNYTSILVRVGTRFMMKTNYPLLQMSFINILFKLAYYCF